MNLINKIATGAFWLLWLGVLSGFVNLVSLHEGLNGIVTALGWIILGLHIIEVAIYSVRSGSRGGFQISDALQVFLFGVFHLIPVSFSEKK
ncbi:hypothetical protein EHQ53_00105 [Leptospira langatensis]|uniref:DUF1145 domain-containing protein n=1 Tax=Leptospira langatensis TaxID=2484983 RepID=A0A5F1ZYM7_9LEPT|nr:hypothetical protein [Leptospira langatensis]TGJ98175.1 hypothetical protein EHO57_16250 [Leptospira langatensis]TGL43089.1 hypothetical protein EHQ53_00105 [Leptospira langatensis]